MAETGVLVPVNISDVAERGPEENVGILTW